MHLKLSGKIILRKNLPGIFVDFNSGPKVPFPRILDIGQFHSPQMKPCKSADYFIKVSFHIVVDMRQGESNIFQLSTRKAFSSYIYYEKSDRFRTGVDQCLPNCPLGESPTTGHCHVESPCHIPL